MLADGSVPLTAFIPDDRAFRVLVDEISGQTPASDEAAFAAVAGLGIDTVEAVLLYHVVPGATIDSAAAVGVRRRRAHHRAGRHRSRCRSAGPGNIRLIDADTGDRNPKLEAPSSTSTRATCRSRTGSPWCCVPSTCPDRWPPPRPQARVLRAG